MYSIDMYGGGTSEELLALDSEDDPGRATIDRIRDAFEQRPPLQAINHRCQTRLAYNYVSSKVRHPNSARASLVHMQQSAVGLVVDSRPIVHFLRQYLIHPGVEDHH